MEVGASLGALTSNLPPPTSRYLPLMPLLATDAIVLHAFDYMETSRILRLVTREAGVQSALAKGARRSQRKYGSALDLFAEGAAQLYTKEGRDLHTMSSFDVVRARPELSSINAHVVQKGPRVA